MKQKLKIISSFFIAGLFLLTACGEGKNTVDINSEEAVRQFLKGKWSNTQTYGGIVAYHRYEITDSQVKFWSRGEIIESDVPSPPSVWESNPKETLNLEISPVETDSYGNKKRIFAKGELGTLVIWNFHNGKTQLECLTTGGEENYNYPERGWEEHK